MGRIDGTDILDGIDGSDFLDGIDGTDIVDGVGGSNFVDGGGGTDFVDEVVDGVGRDFVGGSGCRGTVRWVVVVCVMNADGNCDAGICG